MNFLEPFLQVTETSPDRLALWDPGHAPVSFIELRRLAASAQAICRENRVGPGDCVLMIDRPSPRLYAALIGTVAMGAYPVVLEPWVSIARVEDLIAKVKPRAFFASTLATVLGLRVPSIRAIPTKLNPRALNQEIRGSALDLAALSDNSPALMTFTSSVDAPARAILRSHGSMSRQLEALSIALESRSSDRTHLCVFTNTVLSHLLCGRSSILLPQRWSRRVVRWVENLPPALSPIAVHCSPGFLSSLMDGKPLPSLRKIHLSRALTDCKLLEAAFARWPEAEFRCVYGSSEAEPLSSIDAREAVHLSRERGYIQTTALGSPQAQVELKLEPTGAWVRAPHLAPPAPDGWHFTGDRVEPQADGWWYKGRSSIRVEDFELEQKIYRTLDSTRSFVHRDAKNGLHLVGENLKENEVEIKAAFPELQSVIQTALSLDRRHRSWINRRKTLRNGANWLLEGLS